MGTHVALSYQELRRDMGIDQFDCALIVLTKYQEFMHNYILQPDLHSALTVISVLSVINLIGKMHSQFCLGYGHCIQGESFLFHHCVNV